VRAGRGGGPAVVGGGKNWPDAVGHGICGDPIGTSKFDTPGPVMATYQPGQTVTLKVAITTNHLGRHAFRLCPIGATQDSECTYLQRCARASAPARPAAALDPARIGARRSRPTGPTLPHHRHRRSDGKGKWWYMPMIKAPSGGAADDAATPTVQDGFYRYDKVPVWTGPCATWACTQFTGVGYYSLDYKLPAGMTGRYKLQWYWMTGARPRLPRCSSACGCPAPCCPPAGWRSPEPPPPRHPAPQATAATRPARTAPPTARTPSSTPPAATPTARATPTR
jgi:hypothetical protein